MKTGSGTDGLPAIAGGKPVRPAERPLVFGAPVIGEAEISAVSDCLRSRWIGVGPRVERFEREFARYKGAPHAVGVNSGTAALHLSLVALGIGPGDEVIAPTMTFCSTIHVIRHVGAVPILADCRRETFNLDPDSVRERLTSRTKAIVVVHMCGRCCEMDRILEIAREHGLRVIEDSAHAIEARYRGISAGVMGDVGCFSFYPTKNMTCGDGGMVVTRDESLALRIKTLSLHGMSENAWSRSVHGREGYEIVDLGFKASMNDIAAALGLAQLAELEARWQKRAELWQLYNDGLAKVPVRLPPPPEPDTRHAYHLYTPLLDPEKVGVRRNDVIAALRAENIGSGVHFVPIHMQPFHRRRFGYRPSDFPNADFVGRQTLSIPLSPEMSPGDVADVCKALTRILEYYVEVA